MKSTVPLHAARTMNQRRKMLTLTMYTHEENRVLTNSAPDLKRESVRSGRMPRIARTPPRPSTPPETKSRHTKDTHTMVPSMTFHPSFKYAFGPNARPVAMIFTNISNMKRNVKKMSSPSRAVLWLSTSRGSYRNAMSKQLTMMATKMKLFQCWLSANQMHSLRGDCSRSNIMRLSGLLSKSLSDDAKGRASAEGRERREGRG